LGKQITSGALDLASLAELATTKGLNPVPRSGRQELAESIIARHCKY
jgi:xylose isomerase